MTHETIGRDQSTDEPAGRAGKALAWSFANTIVARFGTLAIGIALARLLGPEEFGTFAVAFVALMAILSFNELGVSLAIVRWRDDPADIAPTVTTISLGMSALLAGALLLLAPWFATTMGDPGAAPLVQLLSVCVLINGAVASPAALMQRGFRQDQRMVADQVNVWVGALVSIGLALAGAGALSLVVGRLAGAGLSALLFFHYSPVPYRLGFDRTIARRLLVFGLPLAGASVIVFLVSFLDQLVTGHLLGPVMLGYYVLAVNLAGWPVSLFSQPLRSVAPALFARLQHDPERMRADFRRVLRPLAAVAIPACVACSVASEEIVRVVYGDQWLPAAAALRWLALLAALRILFELAYDFLVVLERSTSILVIQIVSVVVLVPTLWWIVPARGIAGASVGLLLVAVFISGPMYVREFARAGVRPSALAAAVAPGVLTGVVSAAAVMALLGGDRHGLLVLMGCGVAVALLIGIVAWRVRKDFDALRGGAA